MDLNSGNSVKSQLSECNNQDNQQSTLNKNKSQDYIIILALPLIMLLALYYKSRDNNF